MTPAEAIATGQDVIVHPDGTAEPEGLEVPGLPDGVRLLGFRAASEEEFWMDGEGFRCGATFWPTLVVKAAPGWKFMFDVMKNRYVPAKAYSKPEQVTVHFSFETEYELKEVLDRIGRLPGLVSVSNR